MDVDDDVEILIENHFHRAIDHCQIFRGDAIGLAASEHRIAIESEANVIEAHRFDEGNILRGVVGVEMFFGVALEVEDLKEPMTKIDAVAKILLTLEGERIIILKNLSSNRHQNDNPKIAPKRI